MSKDNQIAIPSIIRSFVGHWFLHYQCRKGLCHRVPRDQLFLPSPKTPEGGHHNNLNQRGGGEGKALTMTPSNLTHGQWSKKFDHGHCHPGIFPMVNGQNGYFVANFDG